MNEIFARTVMLLGEDALKRLERCHVTVVGLGGVGSYAAEAIARTGVGEITLVDCDTVSESNINRQLPALFSTVGKKKTQVVADRCADINPGAVINTLDMVYGALTREEFFSRRYDYIIDAIDTVSAKADLIYTAKSRKIPIISALGTGNKLYPELLAFSDIYATAVCPLARAMRRELKKLGVAAHTVLYSTETPQGETGTVNGRHYPGSVAWVPGCAGLMLAGYVIRELISRED